MSEKLSAAEIELLKKFWGPEEKTITAFSNPRYTHKIGLELSDAPKIGMGEAIGATHEILRKLGVKENHEHTQGVKPIEPGNPSYQLSIVDVGQTPGYAGAVLVALDKEGLALVNEALQKYRPAPARNR
jgi:hypothetical protein